jgi:hypothetical protein
MAGFLIPSSSSSDLPCEELAHEEFGVAMMCCLFSVIQGAHVEISMDASNFTPWLLNIGSLSLTR